MPLSTSFVPVVQARMLPSDFPGWKTVYHYFRVWRMDGTWERINHKLHQWVRVSLERHPTPKLAIQNSQSVKTATPAAIDVGYDVAKQSKGRSLVMIWVDGGDQRQNFVQSVMDTYRWMIEPVLRKDANQGFVPIARALES